MPSLSSYFEPLRFAVKNDSSVVHGKHEQLEVYRTGRRDGSSRKAVTRAGGQYGKGNRKEEY